MLVNDLMVSPSGLRCVGWLPLEGTSHPPDLAGSQVLFVGQCAQGISETALLIQMGSDEGKQGGPAVDPRVVAGAEHRPCLDTAVRTGRRSLKLPKHLVMTSGYFQQP